MPLQATSVLQTHAPLIVLAYVALGTVVYSLFEGWPLIDAAYFTCVTVMTVGYGDLTPKRDAAKCFLMLDLALALSLFAAALGSLVSRISASTERLAGRSTAQYLRRVALHNGAVLLLFIAGGACAAHWLEGWRPLDCAYWAVVTLSSVGYGDFVPTHPYMRAFCAVYVLAGVGYMGAALGAIARVVANIETERGVRRFVAGGVSEELIAEIDRTGDGKISRLEFIEHMLVGTGNVPRSDLRRLHALFDSLDRNSDGTLSSEDIRRGSTRLSTIRNVFRASSGLKQPLLDGGEGGLPG